MTVLIRHHARGGACPEPPARSLQARSESRVQRGMASFPSASPAGSRRRPLQGSRPGGLLEAPKDDGQRGAGAAGTPVPPHLVRRVPPSRDGQRCRVRPPRRRFLPVNPEPCYSPRKSFSLAPFISGAPSSLTEPQSSGSLRLSAPPPGGRRAKVRSQAVDARSRRARRTRRVRHEHARAHLGRRRRSSSTRA